MVWVASGGSLESLALTLRLARALESWRTSSFRDKEVVLGPPAALAALLGGHGQAAPPVGGPFEPFEGAQMALHDAANTCVCGGHIAVEEVSALLNGGG